MEQQELQNGIIRALHQARYDSSKGLVGRFHESVRLLDAELYKAEDQLTNEQRDRIYSLVRDMRERAEEKAPMGYLREAERCLEQGSLNMVFTNTADARDYARRNNVNIVSRLDEIDRIAGERGMGDFLNFARESSYNGFVLGVERNIEWALYFADRAGTTIPDERLDEIRMTAKHFGIDVEIGRARKQADRGHHDEAMRHLTLASSYAEATETDAQHKLGVARDYVLERAA